MIKKPLHPGLSALLEVGLLLLPGIPAAIWLWPNVQGGQESVANLLAYIYFLAGIVFIGRRRWSWDLLGFNRSGILLVLLGGLPLLAGRLLIIRSVDWPGLSPSYTVLQLLGKALFYLGVVGVVEELFFRGLVYRALLDWHGVRWAIWGSSLGFMLWHINQGLLISFVGLALGLVFALMRWRAGGIIGLILLHGVYDLETVLLVSNSNAQIISQGRPGILSPLGIGLGLALMVFTPVYFWLIHPAVARFFKKRVAPLLSPFRNEKGQGDEKGPQPPSS
jgi:membrane protease YdiL (CAAX protease family)